MKNKKTRRGFTIVELVIVVAVIGVLAAVLIPTFVNLTNKANKAADTSLVKNLNTALAGIEGDAEDTPNRTMHDAMMDLEKWGYKLENLQTRSNEKLLWNQETNRFVLEDAKEVRESAHKENFWKIVKSTAEMESYSGYAHTSFASRDVTVSAGFDTGDVVFDSIRFELEETVEKTVTIRTNSAATTVMIDAKKATVNHYDSVGKVDVIKIDMNCYNEYGKAAYVKVDQGKVVAKEGGEIAVAFANTTNTDDVRIIEEEGGDVVTGYTTQQSVDTANQAAGGIELLYSEDGTTPYTAEDIEEKAEVAVDQMAAEEVEEKNEKGASYVARIGAKGYESFKEAVNAAKEGEKIFLIDDCSITEDIGDITTQGYVDALQNEVVLSKDVTIRFVGATQIMFLDGGRINMNGFKLNLLASVEGAGLFLVEIDEDLEIAIEESSVMLTLTQNIEHLSTFTMQNFVKFDGTTWIKSSQIAGGGDNIEDSGDENEF